MVVVIVPHKGGITQMAMPQERLQEFLDRQEAVTDRFKIDNEGAANWALRKIAALKKEKADNEALAEQEIAKINKWLEQENERLNDSITHFEWMLLDYAEKLREQDDKFKTLKLPNGSFGFRKSQPKWHYDSEKIITSLEKQGNHDLIRIKKEPDKKAIKKYFTVKNGKVYDPTTGEELDGVTVQEQPDTFSVKVVD